MDDLAKANPEVICGLGHRMQLSNEPVQRRNQDGQTIVNCCHMCLNEIHQTDGYYRCEKEDCQQDICEPCGDKKKTDYKFARFECLKGHKMHLITGQKVPRVMPDGTINDGTMIKCKNPSCIYTEPIRAQTVSYWRCHDETCDFDIIKHSEYDTCINERLLRQSVRCN